MVELRSADNVWLEISEKCRLLQQTGEPILTLHRNVPNWIVEVRPNEIERRSEDAQSEEGTSVIGKSLIVRIWDSLARTGESETTVPYRFAWALMARLVDGVGYRTGSIPVGVYRS